MRRHPRLHAFATCRIPAVLLAVLLAVITSEAKAQIVGIRVGATLSTLSVEDSDGGGDSGSVREFAGGGFIRFRVGDLVFQPELLVATKGGRIRTGLIDHELEINIDYLEVPVLLRLARKFGRFTPYVMAGPAFAVEIECMMELDLDEEFDDVDDLKDECDDPDEDPDPALFTLQTKKFDIGLTGVAGVEFRAGPGNVLVDARYTHGMRDIAPDQLDNARNRSWVFMAGYAIELSRLWPN